MEKYSSCEPDTPHREFVGIRSAIPHGERRTVDRGTTGNPIQESDEEEWFMKTRILIAFALLALVVAFAYTASAPAAPNRAGANAVPSASPQPSTTAATPEERHPEIREAIASLRRAKEHLEHAAHDFGGHRVEAIRATDEAIHQLEECLKYDKD
jgi:hypothetical protein